MTVPGDFSGGNRQAGALRLPDCSSLFSRDIVIANRPKVIEIRKNKQHLGSSKGHTIASGAVKQSVTTRCHAHAIHHPSTFKIDFQNVISKIPLKFPLWKSAYPLINAGIPKGDGLRSLPAGLC